MGEKKKERRGGGGKEKPETPRSYPKMSPLDAATMQVMTTESVILPSKAPPGASTANPPPAILNPLCGSPPQSGSK